MKDFIKKCANISIIICILLSMSIVWAYIDDKGQGDGGGDGADKKGPGEISAGAEGTQYTINVNGQQLPPIILEADDKGSGGMQGYETGTFNKYTNTLPDGTIHISAENIADQLERAGYTAEAEAIRSGADYDMYVQQTFRIDNYPSPGQSKWISVAEYNAMTGEEKAKLLNAVGKAFQNGDAWSDLEKGLDDEGYYGRTAGSEDGYGPDTPDGGGGSHDPRLTVTPGTAGSQDGDAEGSITNSHFGVPGKPIPTSENLTGRGSTNIVGLVENLRRIYYDI